MHQGRGATNGHQRRKIGRKALSSTRVATSLERRLSTHAAGNASRKGPYWAAARAFISRHYSTRAALAVGAFVVVAGAGAVFYGQAQAQAHQRQVEQQQKIEAEQASKRQDCYKKITDANTAQMGHLTYAELYGDQCR